jgi:hypothetical protein
VQFAEADEQQALLQLAQLPCLHQLSLEYAAAAEVATTADVWRQLPALASLDLRCACQMTSAMFTSVLQVSSHSTGALWGIRLRCCKTWYKTGCCKGLHVGDTRSTISCSCMLGPAIPCTTCLKRYPSSSSESGAFTDPYHKMCTVYHNWPCFCSQILLLCLLAGPVRCDNPHLVGPLLPCRLGHCIRAPCVQPPGVPYTPVAALTARYIRDARV